MAPTQAEVDAAVQADVDQTAEEVGVVQSAIVALNNTLGAIQQALDEYKAANPTVTAEQVAGIQTSIDTRRSKVTELAAAVAANPGPGPVGGAAPKAGGTLNRNA